MEFASRITVQRLLKQYGIKPRKALGQNFLISTAARNKLVAAATIKEGDTVVEVGAGLGAVTQELARRAKQVLAIERDEKLCAALNDLFRDTPNVEIVCDDALKTLSANRYPLNARKVVGNIPYRITGPLVRALVDAKNPPVRIVFMVQKEVGERLCAKPPRMNLLALAAQHGAKVQCMEKIKRGAFYPSPKVNSIIVALAPFAHDRNEDETLFRAAKLAFAKPRKQIAGTLTKATGASRETITRKLSRCGIRPAQRPQELSLTQWQCLAQKHTGEIA